MYAAQKKAAAAPREFACANVLSKRTQAPPPDDAAPPADGGGEPAAPAPAAAAPAPAEGAAAPAAAEPEAGEEGAAADAEAEAAPARAANALGFVPRPKAGRYNLFLDDTVGSFFRRPARAPDGSFLLVPCGQHQGAPNEAPTPTTYVFARGALSTPCAHLPSPSKPVVVTRCCPSSSSSARPPTTAPRARARPRARAGGVGGWRCRTV